MAKEIGIKINFQSTGDQKVITNLQQLENELATLQTSLKTLDFGSEAFKRATQDISTLRSQIDQIEKATEGIGAEKKFRALGDAISVATGSFQVLSGVLGLVITNTESLEEVQKAEAAALQVLNIALGINAINTALVESATLRATLAQRASTIATTIATKAQAAWNAILLANPIGVVVAGIVALTAVIYGLVQAYNALFSAEASQKKVLKEINDLENGLIKTRREASKELELQLTILTDNITTRGLERKTLEDLKKAYPGLNAFIDKNNKLTKQGIEFIKLEIKLRQQQTALNTLSGKLVEKQIEFEEKAAKIRQEYGVSADIQIKELREDYEENIKPITILQDRYTKALNGTIESLSPLQKQLDEQAKKEEKLKNTQKESVEVLSARGKLLERIALLLKNQNTELSKLLETELEYTADILDKQKEILTDQEALLQRRGELLKDTGDELRKQLQDVLFAVVPTEEGLKLAKDQYQSLFDFVSELAKSGQLDITQNITPDYLANVIGGFDEDLKKVFQNLSTDSEQVLLDFFNELKTRTGEIEKITQKTKATDQERLQLLLNLSDAEDEIYNILRDRVDLGLTQSEAEAQALSILKEKLGLVEFEKKLNDELIAANKSKNKSDIEAAQTALSAYKEFEKTLTDSITRSVKFYEGVEKISAEASKNFDKIVKNTQEIKREFSPQELEKITEFFQKNIQNIDDIVGEVFGNLQKYKERLGEQGLSQVLDGVAKSVKDLGLESKESLEDAKTYLETYILVGQALGYNVDEAEKLLGVINKQLEQTNLDNFFDKLDEGAQKFFQQLNAISRQYQNILQNQSSFLLEQLQSDEENALKAVEGTTKRLTEEQEKIRKEYAKTRFEIEKQARITELRFSLAQVISDSALAITNTLANVPTPFNIPLAATIGALSAAQVLQVRNQLTYAQSQQFVGRRGGLIVGQSHEGSNGGVPALLEGGEFVVNRAAVAQYGDLIGELNSATGGRRLAIDDSRLVQTIASQNQNTPPLKAYVLYNDIQSTDKLNSRITKLARL